MDSQWKRTRNKVVNLDQLENLESSRYESQIKRLENIGANTTHITETVTNVTNFIKNGKQSLVIYGEPQSGKTEMMICLTSKLLDMGYKCIVVLITDSLDLLIQNQSRFRSAGMTPPPSTLEEVIANSDAIIKSNSPVVVFCKKNSKDLEKLNVALRKIQPKVIIDDEADYATPNSRINSVDKVPTKINEKVTELVSDKSGGIWIGVTATPARLDLNATLNNDKKAWVRFKPHDKYVGAETFFPLSPTSRPKYKLKLLSGQFNQSEEVKKALKNFIVNVAIRNVSEPESKAKNYSMVIHTSGKKEDHKQDEGAVQNLFRNLVQKKQEIYDELEIIVNQVRPDLSHLVLKYIYQNRQQYVIRKINSEADRKTDNIKLVTEPQTPFTVAIGGNIISRGVTFDNLLTFFFSRNTSGQMQQDTYIQRARMFGNRLPYLENMEIYVPDTLYEDWHRLFVLHSLALVSVESGDPIWLEEGRIKAVATRAIDKNRLNSASGEIKSDMFDVDDQILKKTSNTKIGYKNLELVLSNLSSRKVLPDFIFDEFMKRIAPSGDKSVVWHQSRLISKSQYTDETQLERPRGFLGGTEINQFPDACHHLLLVHNLDGRARIIYKYVSNKGVIKFLKLDGKNGN